METCLWTSPFTFIIGKEGAQFVVKADGKMEWVLFSHSDVGSHTSHKKVQKGSIGKAIQTSAGWFISHRKRTT